jgi:hypothetical protein
MVKIFYIFGQKFLLKWSKFSISLVVDNGAEPIKKFISKFTNRGGR